ncbi:hypothetical protein [Pseudomonas sp. AP19]|uniref:hypothetical protein n=1 Tax=Pseudomonas sp. AP19 TaxID=1535623 RepID=UPI0009F497D4|nr:hypothetical protein [Pseudomonas sp. AP19]
MKKVALIAAAVLSLTILGGCANGKSPLDYETGTFVAPEKVQQLKTARASQGKRPNYTALHLRP